MRPNENKNVNQCGQMKKNFNQWIQMENKVNKIFNAF